MSQGDCELARPRTRRNYPLSQLFPFFAFSESSRFFGNREKFFHGSKRKPHFPRIRKTNVCSNATRHGAFDQHSTIMWRAENHGGVNERRSEFRFSRIAVDPCKQTADIYANSQFYRVLRYRYFIHFYSALVRLEISHKFLTELIYSNYISCRKIYLVINTQIHFETIETARCSIFYVIIEFSSTVSISLRKYSSARHTRLVRSKESRGTNSRMSSRVQRQTTPV